MASVASPVLALSLVFCSKAADTAGQCRKTKDRSKILSHTSNNVFQRHFAILRVDLDNSSSSDAVQWGTALAIAIHNAFDRNNLFKALSLTKKPGNQSIDAVVFSNMPDIRCAQPGQKIALGNKYVPRYTK